MLADYFLNKAVHMPIKYFIWYVIVAGWQKTSPNYNDSSLKVQVISYDIKIKITGHNN